MDMRMLAAARRMSYERARQLLVAAGLAVILVTAGLMYVRRVDPVEVAATLLFVPVFIALMAWKIPGGALAGIGAALAYAILRYPAIEAVGVDRFAGLLLARSAAFLAFGVIGGWANRQLEASVRKLELYDQIDDATGLFNARFFLQDTDLEMSRARRYETFFSVAVVDVPRAALDALPPRKRRGALRELGRALKESVRTVDRAVHARGAGSHRLAAVLPETGPEGVRVFVDRLASRVAGFLGERGAELSPDALRRVVVTFPGDEAELLTLRSEFADIDRTEHPEEHPS